jgi:hypothetical protein
MAPVPTNLLDQVWEYPLFEALYGRRSRRFGLGFEMTEGPFLYKSGHAPAPLSETEEALLVAAGVGFSGLGLWDQSRPTAYRGAGGRTYPSTVPGGRRTTLFFTNDYGVYVIDAAGAAVNKPREIETADDRKNIFALYRDHRRQLGHGRLDIPRQVPPMCGHNLWDSNMPGSTLFMPVCDVSASLISLIAQFVDPALGRFAPASGRGVHIVDDRHDFRPAGTEKWLKSGFLDAERVLPLSILERQACYFTFSEPASICQNIFLATEALGLGGWMHCGFLSLEVLELLGFRVVAAQNVAMFANPIGLDGTFEAFCPPYYSDMDAAVDAALAPISRGNAASPQPVPYLMSQTEHQAGTVAVSEEGIACCKAVCNYILDSYGRFPGGVDAIHLMWFMQVHHIDTDYYDKFFRPGAYGQRHADHIATWHRGCAPGRR